MWIVRLALNRPYTFVVMAILIAILGSSAIVTMPVDIFPYIDIPVVSVLWVYSGLSPEEMEKRVVTNFERSLTSNVNDIEHIESQAYNGYAVVKIYFHPNVKIDMAVAQTTATMQTSLRQMPPGMFPANILKYDAASVPILQLGLSSKTLREQEIFDIGNNFIRTPLGTVQGASVSYPFGGKQRAVMVDLNLEELYAKQLSPIDVSNALNSQNLILPAGTAKLAHTEYQVRVNSSPVLLNDLNNLPDQDRERRHGLHQRRGAGAGRIPGAEQYRSHQWIAGRADYHHQERQGVHAVDCQRREGRAPQDSGQRSPGVESGGAGGPVRICARLDSGRAAGSPDGRGPDRHDDSVVPGELAQHADCLHLDSAFHSDLALPAEPAGTDHQRDDAGRTGAGGGDPGGRCHRRD